MLGPGKYSIASIYQNVPEWKEWGYHAHSVEGPPCLAGQDRGDYAPILAVAMMGQAPSFSGLHGAQACDLKGVHVVHTEEPALLPQ